VDARPGEHIAFKVGDLDQYGQPYSDGVLFASESPGRYIVEAYAGEIKAEAPVHVLAAEENVRKGRAVAELSDGVV
jgi:hypothetical protein